MLNVNSEDFKKAETRLQGIVQLTQANHSQALSKWLGTEIFLKLENEQTTGSFKIRGAYNKISQLSQVEKVKGVIAASAGNHAQGVAYSAQRAGVRATIVMPVHSPLIKILATQNYGAEVVLHGHSYDEAFEHAKELQKKSGAIFVHPYEDALVIAGQGTIGLEILKQVPDVESVVVPIGGGGLISGIASAIKAVKPNCRIYGVVTEITPGMKQLFDHRQVEEQKRGMSIADGISVKKPSEVMFKSFIEKMVDDIVEVSDAEIAEAIVILLERVKTVAEGSGAAALAGCAKAKWNLGKKSVLVIGGGNIDLNLVSRIIEKGLKKSGRLARLSLTVDDRPGQLLRLVEIISKENANIMEVNHDRLDNRLGIRETSIEFLIETRSEENVQSILASLNAAGARAIERR